MGSTNIPMYCPRKRQGIEMRQLPARFTAAERRQHRIKRDDERIWYEAKARTKAQQAALAAGTLGATTWDDMEEIDRVITAEVQS